MTAVPMSRGAWSTCPIPRPTRWEWWGRVSPRSNSTSWSSRAELLVVSCENFRQCRQQPLGLRVGADGDPQMIGDARRGEMTNDHCAFAQRGGERGAFMRRVAREDEIG